jgi:hypothetical protein
MAKAKQYSEADQPCFELFLLVLMMLILLGALGLGTVRFLQLLQSLAVSMPDAPFFEGTL